MNLRGQDNPWVGQRLEVGGVKKKQRGSNLANRTLVKAECDAVDAGPGE